MGENKLGNESSPYLLQHAQNPVDWHAWNEEALGRAKKENKPIFLSVGYSSCIGAMLWHTNRLKMMKLQKS